jgi:hypothetical protein
MMGLAWVPRACEEGRVLRIESAPGSLVVVSRTGRPRAVTVLVAGLAALALTVRRTAPRAAVALLVAALLVAVLRGRAFRARFGRGRVGIRRPVPFAGEEVRALDDFGEARIETGAEASARRADQRAREFRARAGQDLPSWLRPSPREGEHLRRIVLVQRVPGPRGRDRLPVTAWVPAGEDLEPARAAIAALIAG